MIRDLLLGQPDSSTIADVCVVGAGAAGIVFAVELARFGKNVILLEAGGESVEEDSQKLNASEVCGHTHRGIEIGRVRALGGTTLKWGGQIHELAELDFETRDWVPGSGWPISKTSLHRHYAHALELEGLMRVEQQDDQVWSRLGEQSPQLNPLETYLTRWCPQPNFALLHRDILKNSPAIDVWLHANVIDMLVEDGTVRGLRCSTLSGQQNIFRAAAYVFCLGAIESNRFFLQPRFSAMPWHRSGMLGKHFQDHIDCNAAVVYPTDRRRFHSIFDNIFLSGLKYQPKLRLSPESQLRLQTMNVGASMSFRDEEYWELVRLRKTAKRLMKGDLRNVTGTDLAHAAHHIPFMTRQAVRYSVQHRAYNAPETQVHLRVHCEQEPESLSSITLSDKTDELGMLRARLDWKVSPKEVESIQKVVEVVQRSLTGIAKVEPDYDLIHDPAAFAVACDDCGHHMGGMRMSTSASTGIVDFNLRLHGMENAFVCSSAVFPTSGYSNPTHTLLALAVRLAEHLS